MHCTTTITQGCPVEMKRFSLSWFSVSIASKTTGLCHVSAHFVVKQTLFHMADGVLSSCIGRTSFCCSSMMPHMGFGWKILTGFLELLNRQRIMTLTPTEHFRLFCCLGYVIAHNWVPCLERHRGLIFIVIIYNSINIVYIFIIITHNIYTRSL